LRAIFSDIERGAQFSCASAANFERCEQFLTFFVFKMNPKRKPIFEFMRFVAG
jgi:hypothetical protein